MKNDRRRYNDNSRDWNNEMVEKRKIAVKETCQLILKKNEPKSFAHAATLMAEKYDKHIAISAETIAKPPYRQIFNNELNKTESTPKKRKHNPRSTAELEHELYKEQTKNLSLNRELNLLRHQIKQADLDIHHIEHSLKKEVDRIDLNIVKAILEELLKSGHYYWKNGSLIREYDGGIILTSKNLLQMGLEYVN